MIEFKEIGGHHFAIRTDTLDEYIIRENDYKRANFSTDDVWLDIGANIGVFPIRYGSLVSMIYSYEPDAANLRLLKKNLKLNDVQNCKVIEKAVTWDDRTTTDFYLNVKKNKGAHSMLVTRGRDKTTVTCVNINTILEQTKANAIKMDVEGAEYELLKAINRWDQIRELIFEYHINVLRDHTGHKLSRLYNLLRKRGFAVHGKDTGNLGKNWHIIIHCTR